MYDLLCAARQRAQRIKSSPYMLNYDYTTVIRVLVKCCYIHPDQIIPEAWKFEKELEAEETARQAEWDDDDDDEEEVDA